MKLHRMLFVGALVGLALTPAAQVQANSPHAALAVDGRSGDGFDGAIPYEAIPGSTFEVTVSGAPHQPLALFVGRPLEPGASSAAGYLNLDPAVVALSGFGGGALAPFVNTGGDGEFTVSFLSTMKLGDQLGLQALVSSSGSPALSLTAPQLVLSAPARLMYRISSDDGYRWVGTNPFFANSVQLTPDQEFSNTTAAIAPNGRWFACTGRFDGAASDSFFTGRMADHALSGLVRAQLPAAVEQYAWSPDGNRVAVQVQASPGQPALWVVDPLAATARAVSAPDEVIRAFGWSRSSSYLAYRAGPAGAFVFVIVDLSSSTPLVVHASPSSVHPFYWSPSEDRVAYSDSMLRLLDVASGSSASLDSVADFAWAPDGSRFAYTRIAGSRYLHTALPNGTGDREIGSGAVHVDGGDAQFWWSPDSRRVAYLLGPTSTGFRELAVNAADGDTTSSVEPDPGSACWDVAWSPDSAWIACRQSSPVSRRVVVDMATADVIAIGDAGSDPGRWSPRAGPPLYAFASGGSLYTVQGIDWTSTEVATAVDEDTLSWDPSGRWLAYQSGPSAVFHCFDALTGVVRAIDGAREWTWSPLPTGTLPPAEPPRHFGEVGDRVPRDAP